MSQAEKTLLRYQYVMANTTAAQGDFARTSGSWANQIRILSQQFEQLGSVIGGVLINAFKPFVSALNSVMQAVISFAKTVANALGAIFGWTIEINAGGLANDFEAAGDAAEDIADGTGAAADNAEKLNKYIAPWHEVNNMTSKDDTGSGSGGGAGGADLSALGDAAEAQLVRIESVFDKYESEIKNLYELGEYIGNALIDAMNGINWSSVYQGARNFGTGLADFLNGLISPELFGAVGRTIAGALNTAIYAALSFGETFDWKNLGESIAAGINNFFATFDFAALADTLDAWVQGLWLTLVTALDGINWETIYNGVKEFLENIDIETIGIIVGAIKFKNLTKGLFINGILKSIGGSLAISNLPITLFNLKFSLSSYAVLGSPAIDVIGNTIIDLVDSFIKKHFGESVLNAMGEGLLVAVTTGVGLTWGGPIGAAIGLAIGVALDTFVVKGEWITKFWNKIGELFFNWDFAASLLEQAKTFFQNAFSSDNFLEFGVNIVAGVAAGFTSAIVFIAEPIIDLFNFVIEKICNLFGIHSPAESMKPLGKNILLGIVEGFADSIKEWLNKLLEWKIETFNNFKSHIADIINNAVAWFSEMPDKIYNGIITFVSKVETWGTNVFNTFKTKTTEIITNVVKWFSELPQKIYDTIIKIKEKITQWGTQTISFFQTEVPKIVNKVIEFFGDLPKKIVDVGENIVKGLWEGINNMVGWIGDKISGFVNGVIRGFKDGFDEHSPSKIAFEIGDFFTLGLGNGIVDRFDDVYRDVEKFTDNISSMNIDIPKIDLTVPKPDFSPKSYNLETFKSTMQMEMDARMAEMSYEEQKKNALLEQIISAIESKQLNIGDDAIFNSARRGQQKFQRRTFKTGWAGVD